jgi:hypothetical protein
MLLIRGSSTGRYKHFVDKQRLFTGIITTDMAQEEDLGAFARQHLADVMQPHPLRLRCVLIGEADRFPELAQAWVCGRPGWTTRCWPPSVSIGSSSPSR